MFAAVVTLSLTFFFLLAQIALSLPSARQQPLSFRLILSPLIVLTISVYRSACLAARVTAVPHRHGQGSDSREETEGRKEGEKREGVRGGGRDEFRRRATRLYAFLKGCASCSFVPTSTEAARTHASTHSHTLSNTHPPLLLPQWCPLFLQHFPYWTGSGDSILLFSYFLFFFLSAGSLLFPSARCFLYHSHHQYFFSQTRRAVFHFTFILAWMMGNKMVLIS